MTETTGNTEEFTSKVKAACVTNYTKEGYTQSSDGAIGKLYNRSSRVNEIVEFRPSSVNQQQREEGYTKIVTMSLSNPLLGGEPAELINDQDTAIFFGWRGFQVDRSKRDANMDAVVVMTNIDAKNFIEKAKIDPTLVYSLLRSVNKGHIQMYTGEPMNVRPGKSVEILANSKIGGQQTENVFSSPFPLDYNPNP